MLQSVGLQIVRHVWETEQQQQAHVAGVAEELDV